MGRHSRNRQVRGRIIGNNNVNAAFGNRFGNGFGNGFAGYCNGGDCGYGNCAGFGPSGFEGDRCNCKCGYGYTNGINRGGCCNGYGHGGSVGIYGRFNAE